jgi:outer membrane lipoprotein LolB
LHRSRQYLVLIALLLSIGGCAVQRGHDLRDITDWESRQRILTATTRWEFSGRIGVSDGDEGFNGKIWWWQRDDFFRATLSGPLGAGSIRIDGEGQKLIVTDENGAVTAMDNGQADLRARYGWTIPLQSLRFWVLGVPDPATPAELEFGEQGMLLQLQQGPWTVIVDEYREGGGQQMPRRIVAINDAAKVRLVVDNWVFH